MKAFSFLIRVLIFSSFFVFSSSLVRAEGWSNYTKLTGSFSNHYSVIDNSGNYLYLIGGSALKDLSREDVIYTNLNSIDKNWIETSRLNYPVIWNTVHLINNYVYSAGGYNEVNNYSNNLSIDTVEYAKLNSDGTASDWVESSNPLPSKVANGSTTFANNRLYYSGGGVWGKSFSSLIVQSSIYSTNVDQSTGQLSTWEDAGQLPARMMGHQLVYTGKKLYLIGGYNADVGSAVNAVYEAEFGENGKITKWNSVANTFPDPNYKSYNFMQVISGDTLIVMGGRGPNLHDPRMYDKIFFSKIGSDGSLGSWQESAMKLPIGTCCAGIAAANGVIYVTGGHDGAIYFDSVWYAPLSDILSTTAPPLPEKPSIVFLPGMFASWNPDAIVHNESVENEKWEIPDSIDVYNEFLDNLYSVGYEKNKDLWIYNYDWRKSVIQNGENLRNFIDSKILSVKPGAKVALIGHSMGGLVARAAADSGFSSKISHIITIGAPNKGAAGSYPVWEGADFSDFSGLQSILIRAYVRANLSKYNNQVELVHALVPSVQNLLPTWVYLRNRNGTFISQNSTKWRNNVFETLDVNLSAHGSKLYSLGGNGKNTISEYWINKPTTTTNGMWVDGKPFKKQGGDLGDGTVLLSSAYVGEATKQFELSNSDHGEIITKRPGQLKVLEILGLDATDRIDNSRYRRFDKSLIIMVGSPVSFTLTTPSGKVVSPNDNLILIDEPESGKYVVNMIGNEVGDYSLFFGRINKGDEAWEEINGKVSRVGEVSKLEFYGDWSLPTLGADPWTKFRDRLKKIETQITASSYGKVYTKLALAEMKVLNTLADKLQTQKLNAAKKLLLSKLDYEVEQLIKNYNQGYKYLKADYKESVLVGLRLSRADLSQYAGDNNLLPD